MARAECHNDRRDRSASVDIKRAIALADHLRAQHRGCGPRRSCAALRRTVPFMIILGNCILFDTSSTAFDRVLAGSSGSRLSDPLFTANTAL